MNELWVIADRKLRRDLEEIVGSPSDYHTEWCGDTVVFAWEGGEHCLIRDRLFQAGAEGVGMMFIPIEGG